jgi:5-hydroxyisourate hydrolase
MAKLTTHALDTMRGCGAAGLSVRLTRLSPNPADLGGLTLDDGGRAVLGEGLEPGVYELVFDVGAYQRGHGLDAGEPPFLDQVPVRFGMGAGLAHYHVPILLNPFGYSIYRGG